jgi:hypothetical protein
MATRSHLTSGETAQDVAIQHKRSASAMASRVHSALHLTAVTSLCCMLSCIVALFACSLKQISQCVLPGNKKVLSCCLDRCKRGMLPLLFTMPGDARHYLNALRACAIMEVTLRILCSLPCLPLTRQGNNDVELQLHESDAVDQTAVSTIDAAQRDIELALQPASCTAIFVPLCEFFDDWLVRILQCNSMVL